MLRWCMRKLRAAFIFAATALSFVPAHAFMQGSRDVEFIYNSQTARPDLITKISTNNIVAGSGVTVVANSTGVTISATGGGGGGASTLAVGVNGAVISSPTAVINAIGPLGVRLTGGATAELTIDTVTASGVVTISTLAANYVTHSSATANYLSLSSATANYMSPSSTTANYLSLSSATANYLSKSSATANYLTPGSAAATYQPLDATLTDLAAAPLSEDNSIAVGAIAAGTLPTDVMASSATLVLFYSADAVRSNLGLAIGTNVQAYDADLDDLADGSLTGTKAGFADTDNNFVATNVQAAIEELDNVNASGVNAADGKVDWTQLVSVPAGFADGTDDTSAGGGDNLGNHVATTTLTTGFGINATTAAFTTWLLAPQGTNPTVDASGKIGVDTSSGQFVFHDGVAAVVYSATSTKAMTIETPAVGDYPFFWRSSADVTVTSLVCISSAATSATIEVRECDANGASCTTINTAGACATTNTNLVLTDTAVAAGNRLRVMVTALSGTPGWVAVDMYYRETRK